MSELEDGKEKARAALRARRAAKRALVLAEREPRLCALRECGTVFVPKDKRAVCCCDEHRKLHNGRAKNARNSIKRRAEKEASAEEFDVDDAPLSRACVVMRNGVPAACALCKFQLHRGSVRPCGHPRLYAARYLGSDAWRVRAEGHCPLRRAA